MAIEEWEQVLAWSNRHGDSDMAKIAYEKLEKLRRRLEAPVLKPLDRSDRFESLFEVPIIELPDFSEKAAADLAKGSLKIQLPLDLSPSTLKNLGVEMDGSPTRIEQEIWKDRLLSQKRRAARGDDSLQHQIDRFLAHKESQHGTAKAGTAGRLYAIRLHLSCFRDWMGGDSSVAEIDGRTLMDFREDLFKKVRSNTWSRITLQHYLKTVKAFVRWLWKLEVIPALPRILDGKSDFMQVGSTESDVVVFTKEEIKTLLKDASDRTRLYLLLMLNAGMTQKDVSDLTASQVDWKEGRIIRKRSKTSTHENVPTVNYLLWPETYRVLKQERSPDANGPVLVNGNGSALWAETMDAAGKYKKNDNIKNAYDRLRRKVGITKPLKSLKKTSATLLRGEAKYQGLKGLFLGHAPQSMSDKHYTQVPAQLLDQAITWLAAQYDIEGCLGNSENTEADAPTS